MNRMWRIVLVFVVLGLCNTAHAREYGTYVFVNTCDDLEEFLLQTDITEDEYELLAALCERPMNLNGADRDMLYDLPGMTYVVAQEIVTHRSEHGAFKRLDALRAVPGMSDALMAQIRPFIQVGYGEDIYSTADGAAALVEDEEPLQLNVKLGTMLRVGAGRAEEQLNAATEPAVSPSFLLDAQGTALSNLGFGVSGMITRQTAVSWDSTLGALVGQPGSQFEFHGGYVSIREPGWSGILGSYEAGFGERLVFDTTQVKHPHGWRYAKGMYRNLDNGLYRGTSPLFGAAVSLEQADFEYGWVDATAFVSYQYENLYQYHMRYDFDEWYESTECFEDPDCLGDKNTTNVCQTDTDCPEGYTCGDDLSCHSSRIYDPNDGLSYQYQTVDNAFQEIITGANVTWSLNESTSIAFTGYRATNSFRAAALANAEFSGSASRPRRREYGALGLSARWGSDSVDVGASYAYSDSGGHAGVARFRWEAASWAELALVGRWYDHLYDNPFARSYAAYTLTQGSRRRNQRGVSVESVLEPVKWLRLVTSADLYNQMKIDAYNAAGVLEWLPNNVVDLRVRQAASIEISKKDRLSLNYRYSDNDIHVGGPEQEYGNEENYEFGGGDYDDFDGTLALKGKGARHSWNVGISTARLRGYRIGLYYRGAVEDVGSLEARASGHQLRLTAAGKPMADSHFSVSLSLADKALSYDGGFKGSFQWRETVTDWLEITLRYRLQEKSSSLFTPIVVSSDRYPIYHTGNFEVKFSY